MNYLSILIAVLIIIFSCEPVRKSPDSVDTGISRGQVEKVLGSPDRIDFVEKNSEIIWGAEELFWDELPMGTRLEIWIYEVEENELRLYFLNSGDTLAYKIVAPKNAVYESID